MKLCTNCNSIMTRTIIAAKDSHNNIVEYKCKNCLHLFTLKTFEPIDEDNYLTNEKLILQNVFVEFYNQMKSGKFVIDRTGEKTVEILGLRLELDPCQTLLNFYDLRKSPEKYIQKEIDWYDSQDLCVKDIGQHAKMWLNVCSKDEKQTINSNYGYLIYNKGNFNQFENVQKELLKNMYSRRAIMIYNRPSMHYEYNENGKNDFICTLGHQFFIRNNQLISIVEMRSTDMIFGFFSDYPWFATVQNRLLKDLQKTYTDLTMGSIIWISNSAHLYEKHFHILNDIIEAAKKIGDL